MGVGIAWLLGLLMDVARCDGVRPARARVCGARVCGRVLPPARAALPAAGSRRRRSRCCCSCARALVLLVRFVGGAAMPPWTYFVAGFVGALLWPLLSTLLQWPQRPARSDRRRTSRVSSSGLTDDPPPPLRQPPQRLRRVPQLGLEMRNAERELFFFRRRLVIAGVLVLVAFGALFARFIYLQVVPARALPHARGSEPHLDRADRAQPRHHHRPQRRRARANYSAYTLEITPARSATSKRRSTSSRRSSTSSRATAGASRSCWTRRKNFESLPIRTRLTDEEVARFAANRYRFPGVEIKARLFRQYPHGEVASHVIGYIGRINEQRPRAHRGVGRDRELQGHRLHRQDRHRALLRARAARHDRRRAGRGRRRRARGAHAVAHAARLGQQPAPDARHQAAAGRRAGVRRSPRRAGRDRARDRRRARVREQAGLRPQPLRRRHRPAELGRAQRLARQAAHQPRAARRVSAGLDHQAVHGARARSTTGKRTPQQSISDPGFFQLPAVVAPLPRRQARRPRLGRHVQVDRRVVRHVLLRARERPRHRRHRALHGPVRLRHADRHRHRRRADRRRCRRRNGSARASPAEVPRGASKWYPGDTISVGIGQGYNSFTPLQLAHATATSPTTASRSSRTS